MKRFSIVLFLALFLVSLSSTAQENEIFKVGVKVKKLSRVAEFDEDQFMSTQVIKGDKPGAVLLGCWATDDSEEPYLINYDATEKLYFYVTFTAFWNTKVRLHFAITGPTNFFYTIEDELYDARYNTYTLLYLWAYSSNLKLKKGTYTLTVLAEQNLPRGGSLCVATSQFIVY